MVFTSLYLKISFDVLQRNTSNTILKSCSWFRFLYLIVNKIHKDLLFWSYFVNCEWRGIMYRGFSSDEGIRYPFFSSDVLECNSRKNMRYLLTMKGICNIWLLENVYMEKVLYSTTLVVFNHIIGVCLSTIDDMFLFTILSTEQIVKVGWRIEKLLFIPDFNLKLYFTNLYSDNNERYWQSLKI